MNKLLYLSIFISTVTYATCPPESYKVEYKVYESKKHIIACFKTSAPELKHGPLITKDFNGKIVSNIEYKNGNKISSSSSSLKKKQVLAKEVSNKTIEIIKQLLKVTPYKKQTIGIETFSTKRCKGNKSDWVKLFVFNKPFTASYTFKPQCNVQGTWSPRINKTFPVSFKIKNALNFVSFKANLLIRVNKSLSNTKITIQSRDANLIDLQGNKLVFSIDYEGHVDMQYMLTSRSIRLNKESGKLTFKEFKDQNLNLIENFSLN